MKDNVHVLELVAKTFKRPLDLQIHYTADDYEHLQDIPESGEITIDEDGCQALYYRYKITGDANGGSIHIQLHHLRAVDGLLQLEPQETIGMVHALEPDLISPQHTIGMVHSPAPSGGMMDDVTHRQMKK